MKKMMLSIVLALLFLSVTPTVALADRWDWRNNPDLLMDAGILPDSPFYVFDILGKNIGLFFTFGPEAKAQKALQYAEERLAEALAMAAKNNSQGLEKAANGYDKFATMAAEKIEEATQKGVADDFELPPEILSSKHLAVLDGVAESFPEAVPQQARQAIAKAREASMKVHLNALSALAIDNPVRATEISAATGEDRLNRAIVMAEEGDIDELENALQQYERFSSFNREISRTEHEFGRDICIEELIAQVMSKHLSILDEVKAKAPEQAQLAIERSQETSMNELGAALKTLARENPLKAMKINLSAMEERLNRAEGWEDDVEGWETALKQFEEMNRFGKEISEIAQRLGKDVALVEGLVAKATSIHLEVLAQVYERSPEQARPSIDRAMQELGKTYDRATEELEKTGASDVVPTKPR